MNINISLMQSAYERVEFERYQRYLDRNEELLSREEEELFNGVRICELCGENEATHQCEICDIAYCQGCASGTDEGGWNCPCRDCPGYGE